MSDLEILCNPPCERKKRTKPKSPSRRRKATACATTDSRAVDLDVLVSRIKAAVEKYLWKDDENASEATVAQFIDELQADDLFDIGM